MRNELKKLEVLFKLVSSCDKEQVTAWKRWSLDSSKCSSIIVFCREIFLISGLSFAVSLSISNINFKNCLFKLNES